MHTSITDGVAPKNRIDGSSGRAVNAAAGPGRNIANTPPYLVQEVLKAYNADGLQVTGKGQVIAILIDTFPADDDLEAFWQRNNVGVSLTQIEKINVSGIETRLVTGTGSFDMPCNTAKRVASLDLGVAPIGCNVILEELD